MASTRRGGFRGKVEAGAEIVCRVQHALQDLIVVTFLGPDNKLFHGVLLDSTKRNNSPFGIYPPGGFSGMLLQDNPRHNGMATMMESAEDSYPQLSRRHTYYQDTTEKAPLNLPSGKSDSSFPSHGQDKRLKVRLRARQVLCSKCSSICNESGENVQENSNREKGGQHGSSILLPSRSVRGLQIIRPVTKRLVVDLKKDRVLSACSSKLLSRSKPQSSVKYFGVKKHKRNFNGGGFNSRTLQTFKDPEHEARSKHLAKRNILVPKLRRLAASEIEQYSETSSDKEYDSDTKTSELVTNHSTSSHHNISKPLKLKLSSLTAARQSTGRQYSIVASTQQEMSSAKRICDNEDSQLENKMFKKCSLIENDKAPPVLKISIGKESSVLRVCGRDTEEVDDSRLDTTEGVSEASPSPQHQGSASPAYTLLCPSSQKIIIRKVKRSEKENVENVYSAPVSSEALDDGNNDDDDDQDDVNDEGRTSKFVGMDPQQIMGEYSMCVGDIVWGKADGNPWWPGKVSNIIRPGLR